ncbi:hypothetical protein [Candidatus Bathycorpusculum sp.]|jgi:metal-responsive CopG/Arc/MetJ family transcriptional regulator|uniref:hypothetical protein n=1 Tax=Candidatus Bathycorpusculum sp. TaxID=2994959 RepID=UPI0028203C49|nr:ribbon-helix-helix domain-containing protein [Candidatus Termitimicrobium sp.]MCL2686137.1 ribbon-helix-helix domain-containing protein [Candidatus Termitimicrobium sp.]
MSGKRIKRILLHVPSNFLEEFDREIAGLYASRNEAIRAGMTLVLKAEKRRQNQKIINPENA